MAETFGCTETESAHETARGGDGMVYSQVTLGMYGKTLALVPAFLPPEGIRLILRVIPLGLSGYPLENSRGDGNPFWDNSFPKVC